MKIFSVKQEIDYYETFKDFANDFSFCDTDLLFTEAVLYDRYMEKCKLPCNVLIKDNFSVTEPDESVVTVLSIPFPVTRNVRPDTIPSSECFCIVRFPADSV